MFEDEKRSDEKRYEKTLCLTIGDPGGVGPEITAKFLATFPFKNRQKLIVIGHIPHLEAVAQDIALPLNRGNPNVDFINIQGDIHKEAGTISYMAIDKAIELIHSGKAQSLVTGPISKENLHRSGIQYSGHTEILEQLARSYYKEDCQADMLFVYQQFRMLLLTRHIPLKEVSSHLTVAGTCRSLENLVRFLKKHQKIASPSIAMMGVNPHAGEIGGEEERNVLMPAIEKIAERFQVTIPAPFPADALFRGFNVEQVPYDAYVSAYHDQGLIPFKLVAGFQAVNVTIGLPFVRTSVSHGTAPDIVGQGVADPSSLYEAVQLAFQLD